MKANSEKTKQSKKATRRVLAGVLCGASVLSLVLSLVMPPISQAIANGAQTVPTEGTVMGGSSSESTDVAAPTTGIPKTRIVTMPRMARAKTPLPQTCRPTTRRPRVMLSLRMIVLTARAQSHLLQKMNRLMKSAEEMNSARSS